ncbi:FecR family protein [Salegentibacter maritimus]|uniref:FecR family protein n=1 Tax=Salegentibacter maritimus TaxID=2794347 RepID=A0ABS0TGG4_9FLAO|nr:FecR family protein [Salegentibacter maritimus]MBI6120107.1 FecR family protein [Salegentibacter maritimus]
MKGKLSDEEERFFTSWIQESEEKQDLFNRLKDSENAENISVIAKLDDNEEWQKVLEKYRNKKIKENKTFNISSLLKYAAVFIGLIGLGYGYWNYNFNNQSSFESGDSITLTLGNGKTLQISPEAQQTITDVQGKILSEQKGELIDYSRTTEVRKLVYNTLTVPNGIRFSVVLSDSTVVHLNAGSSLKYPIKFIENQNRQVFLKGEAYFDVTKNKAKPFVVTSGNLDVRVLGTKFNVSSYPEDEHIKTVLVEGAVSLYNAKNKYDPKRALKLKPGYKADWDRLYGGTKAVEQVDTDIYTGWTEGKLIIKEMPFKNIIQKLQRHYKVNIENKYEDLNNEVFTATFDIETIEETLKIFAIETPFQYEIKGDDIIIYKPEN